MLPFLFCFDFLNRKPGMYVESRFFTGYCSHVHTLLQTIDFSTICWIIAWKPRRIVFTRWRPTHSPRCDDNGLHSQMATNCYLLVSKQRHPITGILLCVIMKYQDSGGLPIEKSNSFLYQLFDNRISKTRTCCGNVCSWLLSRGIFPFHSSSYHIHS